MGKQILGIINSGRADFFQVKVEKGVETPDLGHDSKLREIKPFLSFPPVQSSFRNYSGRNDA